MPPDWQYVERCGYRRAVPTVMSMTLEYVYVGLLVQRSAIIPDTIAVAMDVPLTEATPDRTRRVLKGETTLTPGAITSIFRAPQLEKEALFPLISEALTPIMLSKLYETGTTRFRLRPYLLKSICIFKKNLLTAPIRGYRPDIINVARIISSGRNDNVPRLAKSSDRRHLRAGFLVSNVTMVGYADLELQHMVNGFQEGGCKESLHAGAINLKAHDFAIPADSSCHVLIIRHSRYNARNGCPMCRLQRLSERVLRHIPEVFACAGALWRT